MVGVRCADGLTLTVGVLEGFGVLVAKVDELANAVAVTDDSAVLVARVE